ncbi:MAG: hypothetical protein HXY47_06025 [Nitrospirae bacterium]|nr:hypothetical protein [Nitrospirota bacterium]
MGRWLIALTITILFIVDITEAQDKGFEFRRYPAEPQCFFVYKTEEEIAWDIVMYSVKNIPSMTFRIKYYEDLLEAYRKALNVIKEPKEPVPPAPEKR